MIQKSTLHFLQELADNNYREWFHEHKAEYDAAKQNIVDVGVQLITEINKFDKTIGYPDPKKCMFRIARDTRFAKDKSPYKTNMGFLLNAEGSTRSELPGYYMHAEPGNCFVSCGVYMASPPVLKAVRAAIDDDWKTFSAILNKKAFKDVFGNTLAQDDDMLSRVPAGFDKYSPAAAFLKLKHFYVFHPVSDKDMCSKDFVKEAAHLYKLMEPLCTFLRRAIAESRD